jgi:hypothetical protein
MSNAYKTTAVSAAKSQEDISKLLRDFGAKRVQFNEEFDNPAINIRFAVERNGTLLTVSVSVKIPEPPDLKKRKSHLRHQNDRLVSVKMSTPETRKDQARKTTYRVLLEWLKSQFLAIEYKLRTFEEVFMNDFEIRDSQGNWTTVGAAVMPMLMTGRPMLTVTASPDEEIVEAEDVQA